MSPHAHTEARARARAHARAHTLMMRFIRSAAAAAAAAAAAGPRCRGASGPIRPLSRDRRPAYRPVPAPASGSRGRFGPLRW